MRRRKSSGLRACMAVAGAVALTALVPLSAPAATVVNGDFETGSLTGWTASNSNEAGSWFAYSGTVAPFGPDEEIEPEPRSVPAPPQGNFAAISDEGGPGTHILYQDVALEPNATHTLSMLVYYRTAAAIVAPESLDATKEPNQQYRVDVMRSGSPVDSVSPADILATAYRTLAGAPESVAATPVSVDLTPFAGQTIRIRLAEVDNQFFFNAGADAIAIASVPSNSFVIGKLKRNAKNGTGKLSVTVPNPGALKLADVRSIAPRATISARKKRRTVRVRKANATAAAPGTVALKVKPTAAGRKTLKSKGSLSFKVRVTFTPTGGTPASQTFKGKLRLKRPAR